MVLAIGYFLMTLAGATHELDHMKSRLQRQAYAAQQSLASSQGGDHTIPLDPAKDTLCFFCSLSTTVLLVVALVFSFLLRSEGTAMCSSGPDAAPSHRFCRSSRSAPRRRSHNSTRFRLPDHRYGMPRVAAHFSVFDPVR